MTRTALHKQFVPMVEDPNHPGMYFGTCSNPAERADLDFALLKPEFDATPNRNLHDMKKVVAAVKPFVAGRHQ